MSFNLSFWVAQGHRLIKLVGDARKVSVRSIKELTEIIYRMKINRPEALLGSGEDLVLQCEFAEDFVLEGNFFPAGYVYGRYVVSRRTRDIF